jgi:hypothetical protein
VARRQEAETGANEKAQERAQLKAHVRHQGDQKKVAAADKIDNRIAELTQEVGHLVHEADGDGLTEAAKLKLKAKFAKAVS